MKDHDVTQAARRVIALTAAAWSGVLAERSAAARELRLARGWPHAPATPWRPVVAPMVPVRSGGWR